MSTQKWQRMCVKAHDYHGLSDAWYLLGEPSVKLRFGNAAQQIDAESPELIIHAAKDALGESTSLMCCVDCIHFEQSGMSRDMGTALYGQCAAHGSSVDLFFHCDQLCSQDWLRPKWDAGKPDLGKVEDAFSKRLSNKQPFVMFEYGTILIEDPDTKSGDYRCRTLLASLINVLPSMKLEEHDDVFVVEHFGFAYSVVPKHEWDTFKETVCSEIAKDSAFQQAVDSAAQRMQIPVDHPEREIAILSWNRFVRDSRQSNIATVHRDEGS